MADTVKLLSLNVSVTSLLIVKSISAESDALTIRFALILRSLPAPIITSGPVELSAAIVNVSTAPAR